MGISHLAIKDIPLEHVPNHGLGKSKGSTDRTVCLRQQSPSDTPHPTPAIPREPADTQLSTPLLCLVAYASASGTLIAGGQRVDTGIVEKSVVAVSPGVGL